MPGRGGGIVVLQAYCCFYSFLAIYFHSCVLQECVTCSVVTAVLDGKVTLALQTLELFSWADLNWEKVGDSAGHIGQVATPSAKNKHFSS